MDDSVEWRWLGALAVAATVSSLSTYAILKYRRDYNDRENLVIEYENPTYLSTPESKKNRRKGSVGGPSRRQDPFDPRPRDECVNV